MSAFVVVVVVVAAAAAASNEGDDLYRALEIDRTCDDDDIKNAFRSLSRKYHPDKKNGDKDKFLQIGKSFEILGDPDLRIIYDLNGIDAAEQAKQTGVENVQRTPPLVVSRPITLDQIYSGAQFSITYRRSIFCPHCRGTGSHDGNLAPCRVCDGRGRVVRLTQFSPGLTFQSEVTCDVCGGGGSIAKHRCRRCHGDKLIQENSIIDVVVEKGVPDDHELVFPRAASCQIGRLPGPLIIRLETIPHRRFRRFGGTTLVRTVRISLRQALLGFKSSITHLDGHKVVLDRKGLVTEAGFIQVIPGEGMPVFGSPSDRGDLEIHYMVQFPEKLSKEQRASLQKAFREGDFAERDGQRTNLDNSSREGGAVEHDDL